MYVIELLANKQCWDKIMYPLYMLIDILAHYLDTKNYLISLPVFL